MHTRNLLLLLALFAPAASALAAEPATREKVLANGLKVVVKEDHRAPVVTSQVWYRVGSAYEHGGLTGISHVLEHMMFKGTPAHPTGEFSRIISELGGSENAFTSRDYTAYFQNLEKSRLKVSFELEADRMQNLSLPAEEFQREVKVVMEERRLRTEDQPSSLTYEQFMATAFQASPYHNPVIGWMNDLENLRPEELRTWYQHWYAPNNATVVVVGDVTADEVFTLAEQYFGPVPSRETAAVKPRREPAQRGERRISVSAPAELPSVVLGYKVPTLGNVDEPWKAYALEVLSGVLDGGSGARLTRELVRGSQIASSVSANYDLYAPREGLLTLSGVPARGHEVAALEKALREQAARLVKEPVAADEIERVKAQVVASDVYQKDSAFYQAMQIGELESIGLGWRTRDRYVEEIRAVTPEQVKKVAEEFLKEEALTVATLVPLPLGDRAPVAPQGGVSNAIR